jgi:hypothetical protein
MIRALPRNPLKYAVPRALVRSHNVVSKTFCSPLIGGLRGL